MSPIGAPKWKYKDKPSSDKKTIVAIVKVGEKTYRVGCTCFNELDGNLYLYGLDREIVGIFKNYDYVLREAIK